MDLLFNFYKFTKKLPGEIFSGDDLCKLAFSEASFFSYKSNNMASILNPCSGRFSCYIDEPGFEGYAYLNALEGSGCFLSKSYDERDNRIGKVITKPFFSQK